MAGIDENIVREYFEANGFLVCQTNKHQVQSRKKRADENIDFFVENPNPLRGEPAFVLTPSELKKCGRAIVAVRAWHTAVFTENMISTAKGGLFDFLQKPALKRAEEFFGKTGGGSSTVAFEDCNLEFGGNLSISYWDGHRSIGNASLTLKNTKFDMAGTLGCIIPVHPLVNSNTRGGFNFVLEGKTVATFGEGTVIDTIFSEKPEQWAFKIQMVEEDGHIPALKFTGGEVNFTGCDLDVRISPKAKKGVYTLIEFANKKSQLGKLTRFTVNGNPCSMGQTVNVGALKATITEGKIGRNSKSDKNVILTIK